MLSRESQRTLSELLMKIMEGENKIEIYRKCLSESVDFNPTVLFKSLCKVYPDSILPKDLKEFMENNSEIAGDQECYLLVRQYSALQNGRLNDEDFLHLVIPSTDESLGRLAVQRFHIREVRSGVKFSFVSLLKEELKLQKDIESLKTRLFQDKDFSLWKAFENLNSAGKGYVGEADITDFLKKFGKYIGQNDYDALMRRIDLEDDLVISYNEFLEALIPLKVPSHSVDQEKKEENSGESNKVSKDLNEDEEEQKEIGKDLENHREEIDENNENQAADEKLEFNELEKSPRFRDSAEIPSQEENQDFETPEKNADENSRAKGLEISQKIAQILLTQIEDERMLEHTRQNLLMQENFSVSQAFSLFEDKNNKSMSLEEFENYLGDINLQTSNDVLKVILLKYGKNNELNEEDFAKLFIPHDPEYQEFLKFKLEEPLNQVTVEKIRDVLEVLILGQEKIFDMKANVDDVTEEDLKDVFGAVDIDDDGEISSEDLKHFLKRFGRNISERDRINFIENVTQSGKTIYFNEFKHIVAL